jgi:hypothetical protein
MKRFPAFYAVLTIGLTLLACRPVIAIGWPEFIILVVLIVVLMGPLMFRLYRFIDRLQKVARLEEKKEKENISREHPGN